MLKTGVPFIDDIFYVKINNSQLYGLFFFSINTHSSLSSAAATLSTFFYAITNFFQFLYEIINFFGDHGCCYENRRLGSYNKIDL